MLHLIDANLCQVNTRLHNVIKLSFYCRIDYHELVWSFLHSDFLLSLVGHGETEVGWLARQAVYLWSRAKVTKSHCESAGNNHSCIFQVVSKSPHETVKLRTRLRSLLR